MKKKSFAQFTVNGHVVGASRGQTVLDAVLESRLEIDHSCGGNATCGTCRVFVVRGSERLPDRNEIEKEFANDRGMAANERLCCQMVCETWLNDVECFTPSKMPK